MVKWVITAMLVLIAIGGIVGETYFTILIAPKWKDMTKANFLIAGGLFFVAGIALIGILILWEPLAKSLLDALLLINLIVSILVGVSAVSSHLLERWWGRKRGK